MVVNTLCAGSHREEPMEVESYEPNIIAIYRDTVVYIAFKMVILGSRVVKAGCAVHVPGAICGCYV